MDRAFRSLDPYRDDHAPAGAGAAGRHHRLDRAMREHAGRRHPRLRALLSGVPVRGLGRQERVRGHDRGDVRYRGPGVGGLRSETLEKLRHISPPSCPGLTRASHVFAYDKQGKAWMAGTSPAMTAII